MTEAHIEQAASTGTRGRAVLPVCAAGAGLAGLVVWATLPAASVAAALLLYAAVGLIVVERAAQHGLRRFGAANTITLVRAAGTAALAGLLVAPDLLAPGAPLAWPAAALALALLALDGVDGWAARRQGLCTTFGARFDMEVDALLVLVLAALALALGKAEAWVLALGLMRYVFLAAGATMPALRAPLFPSVRRKAVCVLQIAVLAALLAPPVAPPLSGLLAAGALVALAASFAVDVAWLLGGRR